MGFRFALKSGGYLHPWRSSTDQELYNSLTSQSIPIELSPPYGPVPGTEMFDRFTRLQKTYSLPFKHDPRAQPTEGITLNPILDIRARYGEVQISVEVLPDRLFVIGSVEEPKPEAGITVFKLGHHSSFRYWGFTKDFGPLDLSATRRAIESLRAIFNDTAKAGNRIYLWVSPSRLDEEHVRSAILLNSCALLTQWLIWDLNFPPELAILPFRDVMWNSEYIHASGVSSPYRMSIDDIAIGFDFAHRLKWVHLEDERWIREYDFYKDPAEGDITSIVPGRFLAFSGPSDYASETERIRRGYSSFTTATYLPIFKDLGVVGVCRLNEECYDYRRFTEKGLKFLDLPFPDGSIPTEEVIQQFVEFAEACDGPIAVHCKAGLGRTGTLIGCWAIAKTGFPGRGFIGYSRIMRPGCILGPQQNFLANLTQERCLEFLGPSAPAAKASVVLPTGPGMDHLMREIAVKGEEGQGNYLYAARKRNKGTK